ncbi:caspase family protein [Nitrobacter sp. NHB1]|uniref:caspase family protein n=1 Tax=Nitrobacter sp. NHB1 TaxID=3119830 RepID=UPI002FFDB3E2
MRLNRSLAIFVSCLLFFGVCSVIPSAAIAQQQEKRIALVIGNGAYAKAPLATAANDGGLIAQTLQAAGFDVSGARDLDGDTLRGAFRDFVKKAEASGPDTVAVVYLAGYGVQYAGENYFIPVDSTITHDTDIPTEGLRIGDYMHQLTALPLKLSIVVLDIAREQPFVEDGSIASGLALVEPNPRMLVAFNAAPGTVAPEEQGPYGVYAQALAEMIRTGGLPLPELFNRVRLRVNENTKGAQVPWDTQKVDDARFMFFDRAPDAPATASPDQVAAVRDKPIRDLGASDAYLAALDRDTLQGYEDFLTAYPHDPMAKRVRAIVAARREAITWRRSYRADTPDAYWSYLRRYPHGPHAADARRRLAILSAALEPPQTFTALDYDVPPPPPDEIVYVDRPVLMFSDPDFDFAPPPPPPVFFLPPPPPDFVVLEPPPPPIGLFYLPSPLFVPIPAYVSAPAYVQPPPNNIIFNNIHNTTVINNVINRSPPATTANPAAPLINPAAPKVAPGNKTAPVQNPAAQVQVSQPAAHAGPGLPAAVMRKATLIQQGKAPVPLSASIKPAAKAGSATERTGKPPGPRRAMPKAGGTRAQPAKPQSATTPPATAPATTGHPPATAVQPGKPASGSASASKQIPKTNALPVPGTKGTPPEPGASTPKPAATGPGTAPVSGVRPSPSVRRGGVVPSPAAPRAVSKPGAATSARKPQIHPQLRRPGPSSRSTPTAVAPPHTPPPRAAPTVRSASPPRRAGPTARPAAPVSHAAPPLRRMAAPPRPAPPRRVARPPRPAPHAAPSRMAPPRRVAPPPRPVAPPRAAPRPPRPAPVARPAPPPHRAAPAAKKCPPNVAKC